eukprot:CAMPEP_0198150114 /NCGR_PEP_ID=MMETSP1443-20131203/49511_1 /TAXON_ID=186043 /ORGANISM="Entomoneis sp., Strain CCMP2396" /LENGTH=539 /DNA_ID=CAMNT_0043815329 /DNA_START=332 /DNA_END=1951 /DNA_ORIENTATION=-
MAGLVGGIVLPLLGAVPDGAIIFFSGLGTVEEAQETLSVGVGALAGSTIMLLTVPFFLSIRGGRVDYGMDGKPDYFGKPKLKAKKSLWKDMNSTGVSLTEAIQHGGIIMMWTTLPYFLIQGPALFLHGPKSQVAEGEHWWSFAGLVICLVGLIWYMSIQLKFSHDETDRGKRMAVLKKQLQKGAVSLSGAIAAECTALEAKAAQVYQSPDDPTTPLTTTRSSDDSVNPDILRPPPAVADYLKQVLRDSFRSYDSDKNGQLDRKEVYVFFRDFNEAIGRDEMDTLFKNFDEDQNGTISLDEFIGVAYMLIKLQDSKGAAAAAALQAENDDSEDSNNNTTSATSTRPSHGLNATMSINAFSNQDEEEEEIPAEFTDLSPDQQQAAIKKKAFWMLFSGSLVVLYFSDPMVDVLAAIADRVNIGPFYVSFVLAPLASNASELIASQYYASKKTRKSITVSLSALEGAACMNNTFCLSIFMGLIFFRGLAWQYSAETLAILLCQFIVGVLVQANDMKYVRGAMILCIFPFSIVLVAGLEALGID